MNILYYFAKLNKCKYEIELYFFNNDNCINDDSSTNEKNYIILKIILHKLHKLYHERTYGYN